MKIIMMDIIQGKEYTGHLLIICHLHKGLEDLKNSLPVKGPEVELHRY